MPREKTFEEIAEELGFAEELPETPETYVRHLDKPVLDEIEFSDISNKIERRMEGFMRRLSNKYESCELVNYLVEDDIFGIGDWEYDQDGAISSIAKTRKKNMDDHWNDLTDIVLEKNIEYDCDLVNELAIEEEAINKKFSCNMKHFQDKNKEEDCNYEINGVIIQMEIDNFKESKQNDPRCSDISIDGLISVAPIAYHGLKHDDNEMMAKAHISGLLKTTGRVKECKNLPKVQLSDFAVVTPDNPDLSYASNPWVTEHFSDDLKQRITEAKERVVFDF